MTPEELSTAIVGVLTTLSDEGALTLPDGVPTTVTVERPRQREHGDYATNVALQLAKKAGTNPRDLADAGPEAARGGRRDRRGRHRRARASSTSPSRPAPRALVAAQIVAAGAAYGTTRRRARARRSTSSSSRANPTGPVTSASARWAAVGDTIARLLEATGSDVAREYYFNDHGAQIDRFSRSLLASARGEPTPEDGYPGQLHRRDRRRGASPEPPGGRRPGRRRGAGDRSGQHGVALMFEEIKQTLHDFRVDFDVYFHENDLHESGAVQRAIDRLTELGNTYEKDGALWLATEQVRRRQGPGHHQVRRRAAPTSPATSPTTSTSASAASTAA